MNAAIPDPSPSSNGHAGRCTLPRDRWAPIQSALQLTERELEIVQLLFDGRQEGDIAETLNISAHTVHTHLGRIYRKLGVRGLPGLLLRVFHAYVAGDEPAGNSQPGGEEAIANPNILPPRSSSELHIRKIIDR